MTRLTSTCQPFVAFKNVSCFNLLGESECLESHILTHIQGKRPLHSGVKSDIHQGCQRNHKGNVPPFSQQEATTLDSFTPSPSPSHTHMHVHTHTHTPQHQLHTPPHASTHHYTTSTHHYNTSTQTNTRKSIWVFNYTARRICLCSVLIDYKVTLGIVNELVSSLPFH